MRRVHPGRSVHQMIAAEREAATTEMEVDNEADDAPPLLEPQVELKARTRVQNKCETLGRLSIDQRKNAAKLIRRLGKKWECKRCHRVFSVSCNARYDAYVIMLCFTYHLMLQ